MITLLRLDERLIHGQIAIKWSRHTGVDHIVVISDNAAANPIIQKSLMMAAPATCKVAIKSMDAGLKLLQDPRCHAMKILVLVQTPDDLLKVVENAPDIEKINVGNYGRVAAKRAEAERTRYGNNLYCYDDEKETLKKVLYAAGNVEVIYQTIPDEQPEKLRDVLK